MIAASRLAEVDRELEAFGVEDAKVEAVLKAVRALSLSADDIDAFLRGAPAPEGLAEVVERPSAQAVEEEARDASLDVEAMEAAAPSQEIELDEGLVLGMLPQEETRASSGDSDFPVGGTDLLQAPAQLPGELELEFDGDLSGADPIHFEAPVTESVRPPPRPSRMPLSQADFDAELAAILAEPEGESGGRMSFVDVDVEMGAEESSDAVDVTDVAEVAEVTAESDESDAREDEFDEPGPTVSTRPPPLPTRPPSMAPGAPESGPGFLGRLLNRK